MYFFTTRWQCSAAKEWVLEWGNGLIGTWTWCMKHEQLYLLVYLWLQRVLMHCGRVSCRLPSMTFRLTGSWWTSQLGFLWNVQSQKEEKRSGFLFKIWFVFFKSKYKYTTLCFWSVGDSLATMAGTLTRGKTDSGNNCISSLR